MKQQNKIIKKITNKKKKYDKEIKKIREKRLLFSRLKMKFFLNISNYTSDLVKHDDWYKKNKTKYNIDIRLKNRTKTTKNILSELLQEYNRNKVQKKFNKSMNEVFKTIVTKEEAEKFAKEHNIPYIETSAKENLNIEQGFSIVANDAYKKYGMWYNKHKRRRNK